MWARHGPDIKQLVHVDHSGGGRKVPQCQQAGIQKGKDVLGVRYWQQVKFQTNR